MHLVRREGKSTCRRPDLPAGKIDLVTGCQHVHPHVRHRQGFAGLDRVRRPGSRAQNGDRSGAHHLAISARVDCQRCAVIDSDAGDPAPVLLPVNGKHRQQPAQTPPLEEMRVAEDPGNESEEVLRKCDPRGERVPERVAWIDRSEPCVKDHLCQHSHPRAGSSDRTSPPEDLSESRLGERPPPERDILPLIPSAQEDSVAGENRLCGVRIVRSGD